MDDVCLKPATWIAESIRSGRLSCVEVARAHLDRIARDNPRLKAFSFVDEPSVLARAGELDRILAASGPLGPLHGVPVGIKDLIFTHDAPTTGGSTAYATFTPPEDDVAVARIRRAGGLIMGKTNVPTFGFGPGTSNTMTGTTRHPVDPELSPGGSSGGSAVAVAAGMCAVALGSDGGGSIRIPAALCGVFGMKPTFGLVPLYPSCRDSSYPGFSAWETVEHIGPLARNAADLALLLDVVIGLDTRDRHSVPNPFTELTIDPGAIEGLRVGVTCHFGHGVETSDAVQEAVRQVGRQLSAAGAQVESFELALPDMTDAFNALAAVEADVAGLQELRASRPDSLNERIERLIESPWTFEQVADAIRVRKDVTNALGVALRRFDVVVAPCLPMTTVPLAPTGTMPDGSKGQPGPDPQLLSWFTMPLNFSGHPAVCVPVEVLGEPVPVGVQLVGDRFRDDLLLSAAAAVARAEQAIASGRPGGTP